MDGHDERRRVPGWGLFTAGQITRSYTVAAVHRPIIVGCMNRPVTVGPINQSFFAARIPVPNMAGQTNRPGTTGQGRGANSAQLSGVPPMMPFTVWQGDGVRGHRGPARYGRRTWSQMGLRWCPGR